MAFTDIQQIQKLFKDKKHILITFRPGARGDALGSSVALSLFLKQLGKQVDIVSHEFTRPRSFDFLPGIQEIKNAFGHLQKFIVTIDVDKTGLEELSYDVKEEKLRIFITPKKGFLTRDQVRTAQSDFTYDLIIVLDTPDVHSLGALYENNTELFYKTPIIVIDHSPANEHFGHINVIDITATATAEVVYRLMEKIGKEFITESIATALLTGIISKTRSFKTEEVKPTTLALASTLMGLGANREFIVKNLFHTKTIATLKLWGQALTHLVSDPTSGLVSTTITRDDFARSGAKEDELSDIIDELITNSPEAKRILILHEHAERVGNHTIHGILRVEKGQHAKQLLEPYLPTGDARTASFVLHGKTLKEAQDEMIKHLGQALQQ